MNTIQVIIFAVVLVLTVTVGQADEDSPEASLLRKLKEAEASLFGQNLEESRNSRQKRCGGVDAPCDKDRPDCCSYAECLRPSGYGWWHGTYYCYRKRER
uniref:U2-theraphotoxin-Lsp1a n=1 Tax=Lasiodora sp. (strain IBSP 8539) TaxID=300858 RepID=TXLT4_LASSB|nr:RecName: Full=U2-theraphotoxin-Lsp1a; Short=U2-TRTX-Lsp1a; AltName: Full=LTx4; Flags: Precursor [Lasiodora sp. IBSP 8539]ABN13623.1 LTx4 toxin [Lasiodora sp. IBSP 8539]